MQVTYHGNKRQYYEYDGVFYTATFPALWAETHKPGTGPNDCEDCQTFSYWNGAFLGYCWKCSEQYDFTRGFGFNDGIERPLHIIEKNHYYQSLLSVKCKDNEPLVSAMDTYLYGISLDDIGDPEFVDSRLLLEEQFKEQTEEHFQNSSCDCAENPHCVYRSNFQDEPVYETDDWSDDETEIDDDYTYVGYGSSYNGGYDSH